MSEPDKPVKHAKYISVYTEKDATVEKWIQEECRKLTGDYREEGVYEGKPYFLKKDKKETLCVFWSTYLGFDGGWYIGTTLGGSGSAWAMVDKEMPPEGGWLMKGSLPGYHVSTPLKIMETSIMRHELHVAEHCACLPCHAVASAGYCVEGLCIATVKGTTDGVAQLQGHPRSETCCAAILTELSCGVPLSWAFEHTIDAWYRAWFIDGFCHQAWYQRDIVGAERSAHTARLHWLYHGYTSRVAEEMACHEPFAQALEDLFNVHVHAKKTVSQVRSHPKTAAVHEETGCHVPLHEALEHLFMPTSKNNQKGFIGILGSMALCFCCSKGQAGPTVKTRDITPEPPVKMQASSSVRAAPVKMRDLDLGSVGAPAAPTKVDPVQMSFRDMPRDSAERRTTAFNELEQELEFLKQKVGEDNKPVTSARIQEFKNEVAYWKEMDMRSNWMSQGKMIDMQKMIDVHTARCEALEADQRNLQYSLEAAQKQNMALQAELAAKPEIKTRSLDLAAPAPAVDTKRIDELNAEILILKQNEAMYVGKAQELETSVAFYSAQNKELQEAGEARSLKISELEAIVSKLTATTGKMSAMDTDLRQTMAENELLQVEVNELKINLAEYQKKDATFLDTQSAHDARCAALEDQIRYLRENEANTRSSYQTVDALHKQKTRELEDLVSSYQTIETSHKEKTLEMERMASAYAERSTELQNAQIQLQQSEASLGQKTAEIETLLGEIGMLKGAQGPQVEQLENEIRYLRETEASNARGVEILESEHKQKCQDLETKAFASQQEASMIMTRMQETEMVYQQKLQELEASYGKQIQAYNSQASEAQQQLQQLSQQTESDQLRLKEHETEMGSMRTKLMKEIQSLMAQLETEKTQNKSLAEGMQGSFEAMRQGVEAAHSEQVKQMQASHAVQIEQLQAVVADYETQSATLAEKLVQFEQQNQDVDALYAQVDESQRQVQTLEEMLNLERESHEGTKASLLKATQGNLEGQAKMESDSKVLGAELEVALLKIQEMELAASQQDEQRREREYMFEQRQVELESEIASLRQQVLNQASPKDDYARATRELRELSGAMEAERQLYAAQVEELQGALAGAQEESSILKDQLAHAASPVEVPVSPPPKPASPAPMIPIKTSQVTTMAYPTMVAQELPRSQEIVREVAQPMVVQQPHTYTIAAPQPVYVQGHTVQRLSSNEALNHVQQPPHLMTMQETMVVPPTQRSLPLMQETMVVPTSGTLPGSGPLQGSGHLRGVSPPTTTVKYQVLGDSHKYVSVPPLSGSLTRTLPHETIRYASAPHYGSEPHYATETVAPQYATATVAPQFATETVPETYAPDTFSMGT